MRMWQNPRRGYPCKTSKSQKKSVRTKTLIYQTLCTLTLGLLLVGARADTLPLQYDSSFVDVRDFDPASLERYRSDPDFQYDPALLEISWFKRLLRSIRDFFSKRGDAVGTFWEIVIYLLAAAAFLLIVFGIMKLKPGRFFSRKRGQDANLNFGEGEVNIHDMDFEALIRQAIDGQAFRWGVRLLYLETLKELTENRWIDWKKYKTNQDYQQELSGTPIHRAFDELTLRYEYVWYGDFPIDQQGFRAMEGIFRGFQQRVKQHS